MNRRMQLDSDLEYLNWCDTEGTPEVVALCEHPTIADARIDGKDHTSVIDMYKLYVNGEEEYNEVKYETDLKGEKATFQIMVQESYSKRVNVNHKVITDTYLESQEMKNRNWKRIIGILNLGRDLNLEKEMQIVSKTIHEREQVSLAELVKLISFEDWIIELVVCRLLQDGDIEAQLDKEDFCYTTLLSTRNV